MGLNSGIQIFGWRKPTLQVSLVDGGTLLANTKYYVAAFMKLSSRVYNAVGGPMSDVYEITTTSTKKSIQIYHQTFRDITAFEDNGDNRTKVTCERHCLGDGFMSYGRDQIKIESGNYAGTWDVEEWIDYDHFIIDTPYVDNIPVQCYTDSVFYNRPPNSTLSYAGAMGMDFYVYTDNPINEWGNWQGRDDRWTAGAYQNILLVNPAVVDHQYTANLYGGPVENIGFDRGLFEGLRDYGLVFISVKELVTLSEIWEEARDSGWKTNVFHTTRGYDATVTMMIFGALVLYEDGKINAKYINLTLIGDLDHISSSRKDYIGFDHSLINTIPSAFSKYCYVTGESTNVFNFSYTNAIIGFVYGNDAGMYATFRTGASNGDETGFEWTDLIGGGTWSYAKVYNKKYGWVANNQIMQVSYASNKFINCTLCPLYWVGPYVATDLECDTYMIENSYIYMTDYLWHFRVYTNNTGKLTWKFLNVNTDDPNNVKRVINNGIGSWDMFFWRRVEFYVQFEGAMIEGVSITITDGDGNVYTGITDSNGYVYIDVLEQLTRFVNKTPVSSWDPQYDTLYTDFTIQVKPVDTYLDETRFYDVMYKNELQLISLVKPIYRELDLDVDLVDNLDIDIDIKELVIDIETE